MEAAPGMTLAERLDSVLRQETGAEPPQRVIERLAAEALAHVREVLTREKIAEMLCRVQNGDDELLWADLAEGYESARDTYRRQADAFLKFLDAAGT